MKDNTDRNASGAIIAVTMLIAIGYAVLRYHIFGGVPWKDFPFLILNKGISLGAFILITFNFSLGPAKSMGLPVSDAWLNARKTLGMSGFLFALVHALMSVMLFSPAMFSKLFEANGSLTGVAGISMLAGILSFVVLWGYNLSFQTHMREDKAFMDFITSRKFLIWALLLGGVHLFFMGYSGWINPAGWHGGLPPISLVAFVFFVIGYLINLIARE
ncbi:MAG: hypothetical protein JRE24_08020 [Deltaproteobacteria bacterium]|nr:hypothetical protein [Deltaproteobacteria bacterium]